MPEQRHTAPSRVYGTREGGRETILTFGDGPHPQHTPKLLVRRIVRDLDYHLMLWNVDSEDWSKAKQPSAWIDSATGSIHHRGNTILLCHDIHKTTIDHFPTLVQRTIPPRTRFIANAQPSTLQGEHGNA